jgi:predicted PurR-regulated permease PerM
METLVRPHKTLSRADHFSFWFMVAGLVAVIWLHLGPPLIAALFAYLALEKLHVWRHRPKVVSVIIFTFLVGAMAYGLGYVIKQAVQALPEIADKAVPSFIAWAKARQIELPFTDYDSLKDVAMDTVKGQAAHLAGFARMARGATSDLLFILVGLVVAIGLFLNPSFERAGDGPDSPGSLYHRTTESIGERFRALYRSFSVVMGAQVIISAINTSLTAVFVLVMHLPYGLVVIGVTFLCGLLPVVGNLIAKTILVGIGITVSPRMALITLIFLVVIHKLEYFLNSKIVGDRIRNPFWLTLVALLVGERLMGIPGMVLAPVILNYIKMETSRISGNETQSKSAC